MAVFLFVVSLGVVSFGLPETAPKFQLKPGQSAPEKAGEEKAPTENEVRKTKPKPKPKPKPDPNWKAPAESEAGPAPGFSPSKYPQVCPPSKREQK